MADELTAKVNGVVLTEAQVIEALEQIEAAKKAAEEAVALPKLVQDGTFGLLYIAPEVAQAIAKKAYEGGYVCLHNSGQLGRNCTVKDLRNVGIVFPLKEFR